MSEFEKRFPKPKKCNSEQISWLDKREGWLEATKFWEYNYLPIQGVNNTMRKKMKNEIMEVENG